MGQSIFVKYLIWNDRLQKVNKLCCENHTIKKLNRIQKIQWNLICSVNAIENGQRTALSMIGIKKVELLLVKDESGQYINNPLDWVNDQLLVYIDEMTKGESYSDFKELLMHAFDIVSIKP